MNFNALVAKLDPTLTIVAQLDRVDHSKRDGAVSCSKISLNVQGCNSFSIVEILTPLSRSSSDDAGKQLHLL